MGYLVDTAGADLVSHPPAKAVARLDHGDDIAVFLKDGTSRHGSFDGVLSADFATQYLDRHFEALFDLRLRSGEEAHTIPSLAIDHITIEETSWKYRQILGGGGFAIDVSVLAIMLGFEPVDEETE